MSGVQIRLDIRETKDGTGRHFWAVQSTNPVKDLFSSMPNHFNTRVEAVGHFQAVSIALGWQNDVVEVLGHAD